MRTLSYKKYKKRVKMFLKILEEVDDRSENLDLIDQFQMIFMPKKKDRGKDYVNIVTDVLYQEPNMPFITLRESHMRNTWYEQSTDYLFALTQRGFKRIKGSKKILLGPL